MRLIVVDLFLILFLSLSCEGWGSEETKLVMVHALFRHGERTTEISYPNDPHINNTFYPIGKGSLTNKGKMQEYRLGQYLRERYDDFLGPYHMDDIMEIRSTGFARTRKSALLVLAGLWPPRGEQIWNPQLPWQPIPVDYKPQPDDDLLNVDLCPRRKQILEAQHTIPEVRQIYIDPYKDLYSFVREKSGMDIKNPINMATMFMIFKTEGEASNLTLPEWTKEIYPDPIYEASSLAYNYMNYHPELIKINAGYLFKKIINDCKSKINGNFRQDEKKIVLYSGHESTVGVFLDALKVPPHIPNYSSAVIVELHRGLETDEYYVKILYKREVDEQKVEEILLPGYGSLCPLKDFEGIIKDVLPVIPFKEACLRK